MDGVNTLLVCVAHPGDFVWRAGGAIAAMVGQGWRAVVICASFGTKGEAGSLWTEPGATELTVSAARKAEAVEAAAVLGAEIRFLDHADCPLVFSHEDAIELNRTFRGLRPDVVLTHTDVDPGNTDHPAMSSLVMRARMMALAPGHGPDTCDPFSVYHFEPHQPEQCGFKADLMIDISGVWETKYAAMRAIKSQKAVWDYYDRVALQRGAQASRRAKSGIRHAEAFRKVLPTVDTVFR